MGDQYNVRRFASEIRLDLLVSREACFVRGMQGEQGSRASEKQRDWLYEIHRRQRIYLAIDREERRGIESALEEAEEGQ